ncbi:MAG: hypothetical protein LBN40_00115 [Oscillospiraceae bacterium]|jgi:hypothetical protein|nr:hypothetical protein [Oscillospiraceae bacterium]
MGITELYSLSGVADEAMLSVRKAYGDTQVELSCFITPWLPRMFLGEAAALKWLITNALVVALTNSRTGDGICLMINGNQVSDEDYSLSIQVVGADFGRLSIADARDSLRLAQKMAERMDAQLTVKEAHGKVKSFDIELIQLVSDWQSAAVVHDPTQKKILLYDKNKLRRNSVKENFASLGLRYRAAESNAELFDALCGEVFTHVFTPEETITDVLMFTLEQENPPAIISMKSEKSKKHDGASGEVTLPLHSVNIAAAIEGAVAV